MKQDSELLHLMTPENVGAVLVSAGFGKTEVYGGEWGWHAVHIHEYRRESSIPTSLGKISFFNGCFSHVKLYKGVSVTRGINIRRRLANAACEVAGKNENLNDNEEGNDDMKNLYNAALLLRDDITTVAVTFDGPKLSSGPKRYNYVVTREQAKMLKKGSRVLVNGSMSGDAVATVATVHAEAKIDLNSTRKYKTVLAVIDDDAVRDFEAQTAAIAERIRERQNTNTRGQLLAALGLTSEDVAKLQSQTFDDDFDSSDDAL